MDALVWTCLVVVLDILLENAAQMTLVHGEDLIETFITNGAHPALCEGIRLGSLIGGAYNIDPCRTENCIERRRELIVVAVDEES